MANEKSCIGCKFLYEQDRGYSNYTVEETEVLCARDRNPNLANVASPMRPWDWNQQDDNWSATKEARCELYAPGKLVGLDVDGEESISSQTDDLEQIEAIAAHSGRGAG